MPSDRDHWPHDWSPPAPAAAPAFGFDPTPLVFSIGVDTTQLSAVLGEVFTAFARICDAYVEAAQRTHEQLAAALAVPVTPARADTRDAVMARALEARRHRNTGPAAAPLDPRRR